MSYDYRKKKQEESYEPNNNVLEIIKESIADKQEGSEYYNRLMNMTANRVEKDVLQQIHLDELKHTKMFMDIYNKLANQPPVIEPRKKSMSKNLLVEYERSIFDKLNEADIHRRLYFAFLSTEIRDMLFEIITDEQAHAIKIGYLHSKSKVI